MDSTYEKYWQEALHLMKSQFTDVAYSTYIEPLKPLYIRDNHLYLYSSDSFYKDTIEERYLYKITSSLRAVTLTDISVKLVINEADKKKSEKSSFEHTYKSNLVSKYVFENFVKGKANELAYATAVAISRSPGKTTYNPLFLYGGVGLGKTHLMHSIGNYALSENADLKVLYCTTEEFTNELITSIRQNKNQEFRDKYREIDILLIDDIQFLTDKEGTQEEFFHTFNALYNANKQIVISSDQPPRDLKTLEDRLRSRFAWGVIVDITLPDFETRCAILEKKAEIDNIRIPKEIINYIAKNVVSSIRDLEGALNKVMAYATLSNTDINYETAQKALKDILHPNEKPEITVEFIQQVVANYFNITAEDICGKKRTQNITYPRQIAMYLSRKLINNSSLPKIGKAFGGRDHSTIIHGCDKIIELIENNAETRNIVIEIEKKLTS